jgi:Trk-type K+ transport system membrane component
MFPAATRSALRIRLDRHLLSPSQSLATGFAVITIVGALLLQLPVASAAGGRQRFVDAFFTASSAVTTTGLGVVDTGTYYSLFQPLSASTTTGFNSVDVGAMRATSLLALIILMFIGASPGGTGGGIKTTRSRGSAVSRSKRCDEPS